MDKITILLIAVFTLGIPHDAFAYIDPTAGGMIVQILLMGLAGVGVIAKLYWKKFIGLFKKGPKNEEVH